MNFATLLRIFFDKKVKIEMVMHPEITSENRQIDRLVGIKALV